MIVQSGEASPDYSGFPHTEACNVCSTRVSGINPPFTRQVDLHTGPKRETLIAVLPGQGANPVFSTHPPNPHP